MEVPKELIVLQQLQELKMQGSYFASFSPAKRGYNIVRQGTRTRVRGGVIQLIVGGERDVEFFDLKGAKKICARPLNQDDRVDNFSEEHLLHRVLKHSVWLEDATYRIRQLYLSYYWSISKSLVHSMAHKLILAMMNGDFSEEEVEFCISYLLGTIIASRNS
ncbi:hypothetical protein V6N13_072943 [Hibiscus sabdariffa]